jgi:hypothetical protein
LTTNSKSGWSRESSIPTRMEETAGVRVPPRRSLAQRNITLRSRGSFRGTIINPLNNREVHYESVLERDAAYILLTDPRVVALREQAGPVKFRDENGTERSHFFDFSVNLKDGSTHLIAVKYERDVAKSGITDILSKVRQRLPRRAGQFVHLRTDRHITRVRAANARLVFAANRDADPADVAIIVDAIRTFHGTMSAEALLMTAGLNTPKGFLALAHAFGLGLVKCTEDLPLTHSSRIRAVRPGPAVGGRQ